MKKLFLILTFTILTLEAIADRNRIGACGDDVTWSYNVTTATLTISGTGPMTNYSHVKYSDTDLRTGAPWYSYYDKITTVIIEEGVTSIGNNAFCGCRLLSSVTIPNTVVYINDYAFWGCRCLTSLSIPNSVKSLDESAFESCTGLKEVTIPNSVTSLGSYVFKNCTNITLATIQTSVGGYEVFSGCKIQEAFFDCESIGNLMKGMTTLKMVTLTENVNKIGGLAFSGCTGLTSVTIPSGVSVIANYAFQGCTGLTSLTIPDAVTYIGKACFQNCSSLLSVNIPDGVTSIGDDTFDGCVLLKAIKIPSSVTSIGEYAFKDCRNITSLTLPDGLTTIGGVAFSGCTHLTSVNIPSGVTVIDKLTFNKCSALESIIIPNSVTSIGSKAFYECSNLLSLTIGSGVTTISSDAFTNTKVKKTIWLTSTPPSGCSYASGTVNYVPNNSFTSLTNVRVYQYLTSLFYADNVTYVPVSPSERTCEAIDCAYNESVKDLRILSQVTHRGIGMTVQKVQSYFAYGNMYIESLTLNIDGGIADYAFYNCNSINKALIGDKVTAIGNASFCYCRRMTDLTIGANVTSIGKSAFSDCLSLESVTIPDAVTSMGQYAFDACSKMLSVSIGNGIKTLPTYAFSNCSSLENVKIGSSLHEIQANTFKECTALIVFKIPKTITNIADYAFSGCTGLKNVIVENRESELSLGSNGTSPLFSSCPLDSVYIGGNISYETSSNKGYSPFYNKTELRAVTMSGNVTSIPDYEFNGCTNLQQVYMCEQVSSIGKNAFFGCSKLGHIFIGAGVKTIGNEAFSNCSSLTEIISKAEIPPVCESQALGGINKWECSLYVPTGSLTAYQGADQWKDFFFVQEGEGTEGGNDSGTHDVNKCANPTITIKDGKLAFACETEGAKFDYEITYTNSAKNGTATEVVLAGTTTAHITVCAKKYGYLDSEIVTADVELSIGKNGDVNQDGLVTITDAVSVVDLILNEAPK